MNKYAVLSTDNNPDYYNLLPLVCYSWKKLGYTPVIIFVNIPHRIWKIIMDACLEAKSHVLYPIEGVKDSTQAQLQRLFIGGLAQSDDILITADADMVIAKDIFTHDADIVSYGFDLTGRSEIPICYVKASASKWRELMGEFHIPEKAYSDKWEDYWSVDQQLLTKRAREYGMDRIAFVDRGNNGPGGLPTGRWDRHGWIKPAEVIDVHMKRNDWAAQFEVFHALWPGEDDSFLHEFRAAIEHPGVSDIAKEYNYPDEVLPAGGTTVPVDHDRLFLLNLADNDSHGFLQGIGGNWDNHRPLLLLALSLTKGDVYEFGAGDGSTPYLRAYCNETNRHFKSYENNKEWADKCGSVHAQDWNADALFWYAGVVFIDHAPGEQRHITIAELARRAETDIIVVHDSEEGGAGDYKLDRIWHMFKYRLNYNKNGGGAGATALSNTIDLNRFRGLSLGKYTFDND